MHACHAHSSTSTHGSRTHLGISIGQSAHKHSANASQLRKHYEPSTPNPTDTDSSMRFVSHERLSCVMICDKMPPPLDFVIAQLTPGARGIAPAHLKLAFWLPPPNRSPCDLTLP
mmetsp:Transcript_17081/g.51214  ORF Transcript_17081/g.51214 Transcript_17081/m.51214 type:complete len:115 (+) Transcript_17081:2-346(+)